MGVEADRTGGRNARRAGVDAALQFHGACAGREGRSCVSWRVSLRAEVIPYWARVVRTREFEADAALRATGTREWNSWISGNVRMDCIRHSRLSAKCDIAT